MKINQKLLLIALVILVVTPLISAEQNYQFSKIYLNPFYRASMSLNTNYTYNFSFSPPNGVAEVSSAIVTLQAYISPTVTFSIWVNNQQCNTPSYTVSTTYAGAGQGVITFDCSNVINSSGFYNVVLRTTQANTGASTMWVDLTYSDLPKRSVDIFGTEYQVGDPAKVFLQLLENDITPVNNASCYLTVYYPSGTKLYNNVLMTYQTGSNGLYYFDFTVPSTVGVYMTEISCEYETASNVSYIGLYNITTGTYISGNLTSLVSADLNYLKISEANVGSAQTILLNAKLNEGNGTIAYDSSPIGNTGTHNNSVNLSRAGLSGTSAKYTTGTDFTFFPRNSNYYMSYSGGEAIMVCFGFNQTTSNANGNTIIDAMSTTPEGIEITFDGGNNIRFKTDSSGAGAKTLDTPLTYIDSKWHTFCGFANSTTMIIYVDGSQVNTASQTQTGTMNWSTHGVYFGMNEAGTQQADVGLDEVCIVDGAITSPSTIVSNYNSTYSCGQTKFALDSIFEFTNVSVVSNAYSWTIENKYTYDDLPESIDLFLYNFTGNSWYKLPNSLVYSTSPSTVSSTLTMNISQFLNGSTMRLRLNDSMPDGTSMGTLWLDTFLLKQNYFLSYPQKYIRGGGEVHVSNYISSLNSSVGNIASNVWSYSPRTLTSFDFDVVNETQITENVWNYSGNISSNILSQFSLSIWSYVNRTLTSFGSLVDDIWTAPNRNLTYYPAQVDLTNYSLIAEMVWNYTQRNLTYYQVTQINETSIALNVWNNPIRNLTYYPEINMTQLADAVWNATNRSLTYYELTIINNSAIAMEVWNYADRNLTYFPYNNLSAQEIWEYANRNLTYYVPQVDLTDYQRIYNGVWNATDRNLTYYPSQVDLTNYSLVAQSVWDYVNRSLTFYQVNNITAQEIWDYTNRTLTYYENFGDQTNYTKISEDIWSYMNRTLTNFNFTVNAIVNETLIADAVWSRNDRNLTYYQVTDATNYSLVAQNVWDYVNRTLTFYQVNNITSQDIWDYTNRTLTYYQNFGDQTNYTQISEDIWNYFNRTLTDFNFTVVANIDPSVIWNYADRNLTFYPTQLDLTDYQRIYDGVWNYTYRNLTFYELVNITPQQIWEYTPRNLTYYELTSVNASDIAINVWDYNNRTLTYYELNNITPKDIWEYTPRNLTFYEVTQINESSIALEVWDYTNRSLTYYEVNNLTASEIWNYVPRNLTFYETVNISISNISADAIATAVWNYNGTISQSILTQFTSKFECILENFLNANEGWGVDLTEC